MSDVFAICNARLLDPASELDALGAAVVEGDRIVAVGPDAPIPAAARVIDADGAALAAALIDLDAHTGGVERWADTAAEAARGGVGFVLVRPFDAEVDLAHAWVHGVRVGHAADLFRRQDGRVIGMTEMALLAEAGARAFCAGDERDEPGRFLLRALEYAAPLDRPIFLRPLEPGIDGEAALSSGPIAALLGLPEAAPEAEAVGLYRDALLARRAGATTVHGPVSTRAALDAAAATGASALFTDLAHVLLNDVDAGDLDPAMRLAPPLRSEDDRAAIAAAVVRRPGGALVSGHRPVGADGPETFVETAPGGATLAYMLPAALSLHHDHSAPILDVLRAVTSVPAALLGLDSGRLVAGAPADLVLFDPDAPARITPRSRTPFAKRRFQGRVLQTIVGGQTLFKYDESV